MLVRDHLSRATQLYRDRIAVVCDGAQCSYRELDEHSTRLANALIGLGLARGDRVAVLLDNSIACIEIDCACAKAGLVRISLNARTTVRDADCILRDSQAEVLIFGTRFAGLVADLGPTAEQVHLIAIGSDDLPSDAVVHVYDDLIGRASDSASAVALDADSLHCLLYTSGTSGQPKGVMLSNRAMVQVAYNVLLELPPLVAHERMLLLQPLSHGAAFYVLPCLMQGGTIVLTKRTDADAVLHLIRAGQISAAKLVPTMLHNILRTPCLSPADFPHLRRLIYGGSGIAAEVLREAVEIFGTRLVQHYGQSEAPSTITILRGEEHTGRNIDTGILASAGRAWMTVQAQVVDPGGHRVGTGEVGEIVVKAPHLMSGYWKNPELTAKTVRNGWLHTSDLGRMDERGYIYIAGRKDDMIISGGFNIAPRDVEDVLYQHPAIREACVVGQADVRWGQAVTAYVALKAAASPVGILEFCRPLLGFKNPKQLYVVDELPKNLNGKIDRKRLTPEIAL